MRALAPSPSLIRRPRVPPSPAAIGDHAKPCSRAGPRGPRARVVPRRNGVGPTGHGLVAGRPPLGPGRRRGPHSPDESLALRGGWAVSESHESCAASLTRQLDEPDPEPWSPKKPRFVSRLACFSLRFSFSDLPTFLVLCRWGDLSATSTPLLGVSWASSAVAASRSPSRVLPLDTGPVSRGERSTRPRHRPYSEPPPRSGPLRGCAKCGEATSPEPHPSRRAFRHVRGSLRTPRQGPGPRRLARVVASAGGASHAPRARFTMPELSGLIDHHVQRPRLSATTTPASARTFVWCEIVG